MSHPSYPLNHNKDHHPYRILFVCLGNICRSPAAEGICRQRIVDAGLTDAIEIDSAGTASYHIGKLPDQRMRQHAAKRGYPLDTRCRQISVEDFDHFDLIITMDDQNYRNVLALAPSITAQSQVRKMTDFLEKYPHSEIPDPYYGGADGFEEVLDLLEDAIDNLLNKVKAKIEKS